jgi:hypothetical protein
MVLLFTVTIFLSAALLFAVQPMFARMVLPVLGGTPAVWTTCMVFFQSALFAGYAYAHLGVRRLGVRRQAAMHLVLMTAALCAQPILVSPSWTPPAVENPSFWLLGRMAMSVGLPFFVIASTAPILQRWFASTRHAHADDPYFLYAASNAGSLAALLAYPLIVEPSLRLHVQSVAWSTGYVALVALMAACASAVWRAHANHEETARTAAVRPSAGSTWKTRLRWMALAAVPSSLMLSVTTYISTDIAAIPLLWIIPLLLYLLTFVLAFARRRWISTSFAARLLPPAICVAAMLLVAEINTAAWAVIPAHLAVFCLAALVCHQQLADERPDARELTAFFLWMSAGGALGGLFNALIAPVIFSGAAEYPIGLLLVGLLRPGRAHASRDVRLTWFEALSAVLLGLFALPISELTHALAPQLNDVVSRAVIFGLPLIGVLALASNPTRFGVALATLLLSSTFLAGLENRVVYQHRNFFGVSKVMDDRDGGYRYLVNGGTLHGMQALNPARAGEPLSYYSRLGPVGQLFDVLDARASTKRVAAIGLGSGSVACYGSADQEWRFYEINPTVVAIARDRNLFTFVSTCLPSATFEIGDARMTLAKANGEFDLIILDAFSSDAIPIHLITREAVALYLQKLAQHGVLLFHITNRHLDLAPVLGNLAADAHLTAIVERYEPAPADKARGGLPSVWVTMARHPGDLGPLLHDPRWCPLESRAGASAWSDDFSDLVSAFKWYR